MNKLIFKQTKEEMFIGFVIKCHYGSMKQLLMTHFFIMKLNGKESEFDPMKKNNKKYWKLLINNKENNLIYIYHQILILFLITKYTEKNRIIKM